VKKVKFIAAIKGLGVLSEIFDVGSLEPISSCADSSALSEKYAYYLHSWGDSKVFLEAEEAMEDEPVGITVRREEVQE